MKYTVVIARELEKGESLGVMNWAEWGRPCLIYQMRIRIKDGWVPQGGISYCKHEEFGWVWSQAMVKECEDECVTPAER